MMYLDYLIKMFGEVVRRKFGQLLVDGDVLGEELGLAQGYISGCIYFETRCAQILDGEALGDEVGFALGLSQRRQCLFGNTTSSLKFTRWGSARS